MSAGLHPDFDGLVITPGGIASERISAGLPPYNQHEQNIPQPPARRVCTVNGQLNQRQARRHPCGSIASSRGPQRLARDRTATSTPCPSPSTADLCSPPRTACDRLPRPLVRSGNIVATAGTAGPLRTAKVQVSPRSSGDRASVS